MALASEETFPPELPYGEVLYDTAEVYWRIGQLATEVNERYDGLDPLFISNNDGAFMFTATLLTEAVRQNPHLHPRIRSMKISAYGKHQAAGAALVKQDLPEGVALEGQLVVGIDELVDEAHTALAMRDFACRRGAAGFELVTLAEKAGANKQDLVHPINGFMLPKSLWVTGWGMDDSSVVPGREANRFLDKIAVAKDKMLLPEWRRWIEEERAKLGLPPRVGTFATMVAGA